MSKSLHGSRKTIIFFLFLCCTFAALASIVYCARRTAYCDWKDGWKAWKANDAQAALSHWQEHALLAPFNTFRPARLYYWRIRAYERIGRTREAQTTAALLAARFPRDFYSIVLAYEGKYPALCREVFSACAAANYPKRWEKEAQDAAQKTGVPRNLIFAVIKHESKFRDSAVSRCGAIGLMQMMPKTAEETARKIGGSLSPYTPAHNILMGASHFARLDKMFPSHLPQQIAAYNAGAAAVRRWNDGANWIEWTENIPFPQTKEYVCSVLENYAVYNAMDGQKTHIFSNILAPRHQK